MDPAQNADGSRQPDAGEFRVADAERLEFPAESFDLVYSHGVLHHTPDARAAAVSMRSICASGVMPPRPPPRFFSSCACRTDVEAIAATATAERISLRNFMGVTPELKRQWGESSDNCRTPG